MRFPEFIEKLPQAELPVQGAKGYVLQAANHQVVFLATEGDLFMPEHSHAAQLEIPLEGTVELGISGQVKKYGPGQAFYVPAGAPHSGKVKGPYTAVIVFDSPNRYQIKK